MSGTCRKIRRKEKRIENFSRKPEGRILLGRPRRRWNDNIKVDLEEIECESVN
jgi:hypothetical protein